LVSELTPNMLKASNSEHIHPTLSLTVQEDTRGGHLVWRSRTREGYCTSSFHAPCPECTPGVESAAFTAGWCLVMLAVGLLNGADVLGRQQVFWVLLQCKQRSLIFRISTVSKLCSKLQKSYPDSQQLGSYQTTTRFCRT
jgi:hypothetical protein